MKKIYFLFVTLLFLSCSKEEEFKKIEVKNKIIIVSKDRKGVEKPISQEISDADWKILIADFEKIDLEQIPNLKAPSEKRFYDGAAIANLKIIYKEKIYESTSFDHGNAPSEIKEIVDKINDLVKRIIQK